MTRPQFADFLNAQGAHIATRNSRRQPTVTNIDARISKRFGITHGLQLELIGEVFNLLAQSNQFITSTNQSLYTVNYTSSTDKFTTITKNPNYGIPTSYNTAVDPRQYQVAAKIVF